jgi:hypothetical protein
MINEPQVEWIVSPNYDAQDSSFYDSGVVAIVSHNDKKIEVHSCGFIDLIYKDERIRYPQHLIESGITDDYQLLTEEESSIEWLENNWFESFYMDGPYFVSTELISSSILDAVNQAKKYIRENS